MNLLSSKRCSTSNKEIRLPEILMISEVRPKSTNAPFLSSIRSVVTKGLEISLTSFSIRNLEIKGELTLKHSASFWILTLFKGFHSSSSFIL